MAKLRCLIAGCFKFYQLIILFVACTPFLFNEVAKAQSVIVDTKVLETLGEPPNVASALLGKITSNPVQRTTKENFDSFIVVPSNFVEKGPLFPIVIEGRFYPPTGKIGLQKKYIWDPSLIAPPVKTKKVKKPISRKKQRPPRVNRSSSKGVVQQDLIPKPVAEPKPQSSGKTGETLVSALKHNDQSSKADKSETPNESKMSTKTPVKTGKKFFSIKFGVGITNLNAQAQKTLGSIASGLRGSEGSRVEVRAFASSVGITESQARRLSLTRALAVRTSLIALGIRSTRIDVRALGSKGQTTPPDRVDLLIN